MSAAPQPPDGCTGSPPGDAGGAAPVQRAGQTPANAPVRGAEGRWPAVLDVPAAGRLLGLGRSAAYELVAAGQWPTPVLRLGRRWRIPTAPLLALLGLDTGPHAGGDLSVPGEKIEVSPTAPDALPQREETRS